MTTNGFFTGLSSEFLNTSCLDHEELDDMHKGATVVAPGAITLCDHIGITDEDVPMETDENVPMVNKGNNKITDLRTILPRESQNS